MMIAKQGIAITAEEIRPLGLYKCPTETINRDEQSNHHKCSLLELRDYKTRRTNLIFCICFVAAIASVHCETVFWIFSFYPALEFSWF